MTISCALHLHPLTGMCNNGCDIQIGNASLRDARVPSYLRFEGIDDRIA
jgi:hypothetical protein